MAKKLVFGIDGLKAAAGKQMYYEDLWLVLNSRVRTFGDLFLKYGMGLSAEECLVLFHLWENERVIQPREHYGALCTFKGEGQILNLASALEEVQDVDRILVRMMLDDHVLPQLAIQFSLGLAFCGSFFFVENVWWSTRIYLLFKFQIDILDMQK